MDASKNKHSNNLTEWKTPFALKVWFYEAEISEKIYKIWCKITGGKFERREKERPNSCVLVTKRGFHFLSGLLRKNMSIIPSELEAYQMNCPEKVPTGLGQTAYKHWYLTPFKCSDCERCFEVQKDDKKIIGKF